MTSQPRSNAVVYLALTGHTLISGITYLAAKRVIREISPGTLVVVRLTLAAVLLTVLLLVTSGARFPPPGARLRVLGLGLLAGPLNQGLFLTGLARSTAVHAALIYALTPLGIYGYLLARGREASSWRRFTGIAIAFAGVLVLLLGRGLAAATGPMHGDLLILGAVAAWALYTAEGRSLIAEHGPVRSTAWTMITGALLVLPFAPWLVHPDALAAASPTAVAWLAFLVVFTSVIAYLLWYYALSRVVASKAAVFSNLQPVATALFAWALLGESLNWELGVGGVLVLAGVRITQR